ASGWTSDARVSLAALTLAAVGVYCAFGVFWTLPSAVLAGTAAAGGIALINSVGNLGGYVGPVVVGRLRDATGRYAAGLYVISAAMAVAGVLVLLLRDRMPRPRTTTDSG
ncbi:MAG TPA: hypothetical protein VGP25_03945, partial [Gemmatimonadaceae bacterium]|nr:hypothetical protein [Gemmatimonadaceae bacterium]